ncbi:MAG: IS21 family transposase [Cyanothece sp. SIO1E1]|nr:IS21 family transposase [Cyanothece sp. SIO1E1]
MSCKRQGKLLPMTKFREIIRLHELGRNQTEIAHSCSVARSTVQDYIRRAGAKNLSYAQLSEMSDSQAQTYLGKHQGASVPAKAIEFEPIHRELSHKGVTLALLWQEGIERGDWTISYGQFCRRYNQWKGRQNLSMRQVYQGGDKLFVDYCGLTIPVTHPVTGEVSAAQIFVACLGASNYTFAEATPSQALPYWIGSHQRSLSFFGGVPACIVPDNLKSGVTTACRYEPGLNRSYQDFAAHYGVAVMPARPRRPRDKSKVEKAVQEVERQILAPLRHQSFSHFRRLNEAIRPLLKRLNERTMQTYGLSRRQLFEQVDLPALKPLPQHPFVFANWKQAKVNLDYHLEVERHYYSVPYWYVRREVSVKVSEQLVEIFYEHQRIALHPRSFVTHRHSTLPEHMPPEHWAYKSQSQEKFLAWAQQVGPQTKTQVETIFASKPHPEQAFRTLKGVQGLSTRYSSERLEAACQRANALGMSGYRRLKAMLEHQFDTLPLPGEVTSSDPIDHDNVRGQTYYN